VQSLTEQENGSFVYRKGIEEANYGFSTAVGLLNSVINFALVVITNKFSRKVANKHKL